MIFKIIPAFALGIVVISPGLFFVFRKISLQTYCRWMSTASSLDLMSAFHQHDTALEWAGSVTLVIFSFIWWNSGGGDDTKRRLKNLRKKFAPTRRTAPVTS